jgi:hypothetical protein
MGVAPRIALFAAAVLAGCATVPPSGPSVLVLPGGSKSFEQFRADEADCRHYAGGQAGMSAEQASADSAVKSAAVGTAVGAAAGALIGGRDGAAVGAGTGLIVGSAAGAGAAGASARTLQQRYDIAYQQCMYAKGHRVPVAGRFESPRRSARTAPPPPPDAPPPR